MSLCHQGDSTHSLVCFQDPQEEEEQVCARDNPWHEESASWLHLPVQEVDYVGVL